MPVFFQENDYRDYLQIISATARQEKVDIWAYCLMPNHVHFICVPRTREGLARLFRDAHGRYTRKINRREDWAGNLWQGRFTSIVMDEPYTLMAARYIERNPVKARIVRNPTRYRWSSADAHCRGADDGVVSVQPLLKLVPDWQAFLSHKQEDASYGEQLETLDGKNGGLGSDSFLDRIEKRFSVNLRVGSRGRPKKGTE